MLTMLTFACQTRSGSGLLDLVGCGRGRLAGGSVQIEPALSGSVCGRASGPGDLLSFPELCQQNRGPGPGRNRSPP